MKSLRRNPAALRNEDAKSQYSLSRASKMERSGSAVSALDARLVIKPAGQRACAPLLTYKAGPFFARREQLDCNVDNASSRSSSVS